MKEISAEILTPAQSVGAEKGGSAVFADLIKARLIAEWIEEDAGHAHKYYRLTPQGERTLRAMVRDWRNFTTAFQYLTGHLHE